MFNEIKRFAIWSLLIGVALVRPAISEDALLPEVERLPTMADFAEQTNQLEAELETLRRRLDTMEYGACDSIDNCCSRVNTGWHTDFTYLNWKMRRSDLDFAIPTDDSALAVGVGPVRRLEFGRDSGMRARIGYLTASGWALSFSYTYFHTSSSAFAAEPAGGVMWATRSHPDANEEAATARAFGNFDYDVFDLEASYLFQINQCAELKLISGLRWAVISQDMRFEYDGRDFDNALLTQPNEMNAFGIPLGLESHWRICHGFSLFGRGVGAIMYGRFNSRLVETSASGADLIVDVSDNYSQAVVSLEAALGVSWQNDWLEIRGGYELTNWFNIGNRSGFNDSVHEGLYASGTSDVLLEGFFVRAAIWF